MKICKQVTYEGRVQGVGFRATVRWIAEGFEIVGTVKNLPDGRVELVAQGEAGEVADFIAAIAESSLAGQIRMTLEEKSPLETGLRGFVIG